MSSLSKNLERMPSPEKKIERRDSRRIHKIEQPPAVERPIQSWPMLDSQTQPSAPRPLVAEKQQIKEIKSILSEDISKIFFNLSETQKQKIRFEGEIVAKQISGLLNQLKVQVKKIADLIRCWLILIPGINKFFLEQEVKIKTDKLLNLKK